LHFCADQDGFPPAPGEAGGLIVALRQGQTASVALRLPGAGPISKTNSEDRTGCVAIPSIRYLILQKWSKKWSK
jgi:hypothetical protein